MSAFFCSSVSRCSALIAASMSGGAPQPVASVLLPMQQACLGQQCLGGDVQRIGDQPDDPDRRLMQAALDLAEIRVGQLRALGQLPQGEVGQLALVADEGAERLHLGVPGICHRCPRFTALNLTGAEAGRQATRAARLQRLTIGRQMRQAGPTGLVLLRGASPRRCCRPACERWRSCSRSRLAAGAACRRRLVCVVPWASWRASRCAAWPWCLGACSRPRCRWLRARGLRLARIGGCG